MKTSKFISKSKQRIFYSSIEEYNSTYKIFDNLGRELLSGKILNAKLKLIFPHSPTEFILQSLFLTATWNQKHLLRIKNCQIQIG
jgi:hypothetical protein